MMLHRWDFTHGRNKFQILTETKRRKKRQRYVGYVNIRGETPPEVVEATRRRYLTDELEGAGGAPSSDADAE